MPDLDQVVALEAQAHRVAMALLRAGWVRLEHPAQLPELTGVILMALEGDPL